jgi:glycosyltransferase involved in cell wall biosynthesis
MTVSIIIPVYNAEKYIARCFYSVANQTYRDIECIFVDDCSTDGGNALLGDLILKYNGPVKFSFVRHDKNLGASGARNTGTNIAVGEYVYYLDSDDEIAPECISTLTALALKYPGVDLVLGNAVSVPPSSSMLIISDSKFPEYSDDKLWIKKHFFRKPRIPHNPVNRLVRREFLVKNNLYFKEGIICEDLLWNFFVAKKIASVAFSKEQVYKCHITRGSVMRSGSYYKEACSMLKIIQDMLENIDAELPRDQRLFVALQINVSLRRIKPNTKEFALTGQYRLMIRRLLKESLMNLRAHEILIFILLLVPDFWGVRTFTQAVIGGWRKFK